MLAPAALSTTGKYSLYGRFNAKLRVFRTKAQIPRREGSGPRTARYLLLPMQPTSKKSRHLPRSHEKILVDPLSPPAMTRAPNMKLRRFSLYFNWADPPSRLAASRKVTSASRKVTRRMLSGGSSTESQRAVAHESRDFLASIASQPTVIQPGLLRRPRTKLRRSRGPTLSIIARDH